MDATTLRVAAEVDQKQCTEKATRKATTLKLGSETAQAIQAADLLTTTSEARTEGCTELQAFPSLAFCGSAGSENFAMRGGISVFGNGL